MRQDIFMFLITIVILIFLVASLAFMMKKTQFLARMDYAIERYFPVPPTKEIK